VEDIEHEGIFRVSGIADQVKAIHAKLAEGGDISATEDNPHNVAGALKLYLRELEQPLIPFAHYEAVVSAMSTGGLGAPTHTKILPRD